MVALQYVCSSSILCTTMYVVRVDCYLYSYCSTVILLSPASYTDALIVAKYACQKVVGQLGCIFSNQVLDTQVTQVNNEYIYYICIIVSNYLLSTIYESKKIKDHYDRNENTKKNHFVRTYVYNQYLKYYDVGILQCAYILHTPHIRHFSVKS